MKKVHDRSGYCQASQDESRQPRLSTSRCEMCDGVTFLLDIDIQPSITLGDRVLYAVLGSLRVIDLKPICNNTHRLRVSK